MASPSTHFTRLRLRAFALGCGVFLLFAGVTVQLSRFVEAHEFSEQQAQLERDGIALKQRLETGLRERVTLMRQAVSYWIHSEEVTREEFRGYTQRLRGETEFFFNLSYSGPDFKLRWAEPDSLESALAGLDHSRFPDRYPGMNPREVNEDVRIGSVYRLLSAGRDGFCIIAPIFRAGRFDGFITGTVVLDDFVQPLLEIPTRAARHARLTNENGQVLYESGPPLRETTPLFETEIEVANLRWNLQVRGQPDIDTALLEANESILLLGLVTAALLGLAMGTLWMGKQRLRESESTLRKNYADLEHANRQSEQAIAQLEGANAQLEHTNVQLESTNMQLESANAQLENANDRLESANQQLGTANSQLGTANEQLAVKNEQLATVNQELEAANSQLRDLNKELDDFTHVVSHDLKEPLRGIQAFSQFLVEDYGDKLDDMGRSYLENLMSSASRMQQLINDLMQLARVTKTRSISQAVDMNAVLKTATQDLSYSIQSRKAVVDTPPNLPQVWGDPIHLQIVVKNLFSNALKYNDKPEPHITVRWFDRGSVIEFRFEDNGIGIDPRFQKKIFELFERLVTQEEYEGTGAGLAISRKIIEQHGGTIWVESEPGQGSTFCFTLPGVDYGWSRTATNPRGIPVQPPPGYGAQSLASGSFPTAPASTAADVAPLVPDASSKAVPATPVTTGPDHEPGPDPATADAPSSDDRTT